MKENLHDFMSDLNEIIEDVDWLVDTIETNMDGLVELYDSEKARNLLNVYLSVLKAIQEDTTNLNDKINRMVLDMK